MKKIISTCTVVAFMFISCSNENKPDPQPKKITVKTPSPTIIIKDPPEKITTVSIDKSGIKVQTKKPTRATKDSIQQ